MKNRILIGAIIILVIIVVIIAVVYKKSDEKIIDYSKYFEIINESELSETEQDYLQTIKDKVASNTDDYQTAVQLGNLLYSSDYFKEAEELYLQLLPLRENDWIVWQNLASSYKAQEKYEEAAEMYYKIIEANILYMNAYFGLETMYRYGHLPADGTFPEALQEAREADVTNQFESTLLKKLAFYYYYQKDNQKALEYFEEYVEKYPDDEAVRGVYEEVKAEVE